MHAIFLILCCTATVTFGQSNFTETFLSLGGPVAYDDEKYEDTIGPNPVSRFLCVIIVRKCLVELEKLSITRSLFCMTVTNTRTKLN